MGRAIVAVFAGSVAAFLVILAIETIGHLVVPAGVAPSLGDRAAMRDYLAALPAAAYAVVLIAYAAGAYVGARVAATIAPLQGARCAWIVGLFVLAATVANLVMLAHPAWFAASTIVLILFGTWFAGRAPGPATETRN